MGAKVQVEAGTLVVGMALVQGELRSGVLWSWMVELGMMRQT